MKIRNRWVIRWIGLLGALVLRLYLGTLRLRYRQQVADTDPLRRDQQGRYIYAFWHENLLLPCLFGHRRLHVLISEHADGEMIALACHHLGFSLIRGSSTRGGVRALRKMLGAMKKGHVTVVPDGPRGPRRHVEPGLLYLAARTGMPIVPAGVGYDRPWRLKTWDRFAVPRPFSKAVLLLAEPILVPGDADRRTLDEYAGRVEAALNEATAAAEALAEGRPVGRPAAVSGELRKAG